MKKYLPLFILFTSFCFSQNRVNVNNLVKYGEKYYKENDDRPFNGVVFDISKETGNKILNYKMVDGLKNGPYQEWYADGKPKSKGKYLNNLPNGIMINWDEDGKENLATYKNGKLNGLKSEWKKDKYIIPPIFPEAGELHYKHKLTYKNDVIVGQGFVEHKAFDCEETYSSGKLNGLTVCSNKDGVKMMTITLQDGKLNGVFTQWREDGTKMKEKIYKNGLQDGKEVGWHSRKCKRNAQGTEEKLYFNLNEYLKFKY